MTELIKTVADLRGRTEDWRRAGLSWGLVPTMGFLHAGHIGLIDRARAENDRVVVSIFVNPLQFGPAEDLAGYPRDLEHDLAVCEKAGVAAVFQPEAGEMYPPDFRSRVDMDELTDGLCGAGRPGHFQGVLTVVAKLLNIVQPARAYFGRKDAQQLAAVVRLVRDLNLPTAVVPCPLARAEDGLALSSRNSYLNAEERRAALCLSQALAAGRRLLEDGERNSAALKAAMRAVLEAEPLARTEYLEIVDAETLQPAPTADRPILAALAVFIGRTRLIDNFSFDARAGVKFY